MSTIIDSKSLANVSWIEHQMLEHIKNALRVTIQWKAPSVSAGRKLSSVKFAMQSFQRHLQRVTQIEEEDGYLYSIAESKPNVQHRVEQLHHEHSRFRLRVEQLTTALADLSDWQIDELEVLCQQISGLLEDVDRHDAAEIDLLQEAMLSDEGGEG